MEFRDLKLQYKKNKDVIDNAIQGVLKSGQYIGGNTVTELEKKLASYVGVKHCITCANGTDALQLALMAWGVGYGDAVFVPDFTFFATAEVVPWLGATPVFVDVEEDTFNISAKSLETAIEKVLEEGGLVPKVVVAVDLFGQPANYQEIRKITDKYGLLLLEDGAQGFGGKIGQKMACSFGDISTTSFFPAKPLGCYGDGGAIFTDNDDWAEIINSYKVHGRGTDKYDNVRIGMNSRLDTIQAAILLAKFDVFIEKEIDCINNAARYFDKRINKIVKTPKVQEGYISSWAQYTIVLKNRQERDGLQNYLKAKNIPAMIYYARPMHKQKVFSNMKHYTKLEITEKLCETVLSLPIHPYIDETIQDIIVKNIFDFFTENE